MLLLLPLKTWGNESSERQHNYPEITKLVGGRAEFEWRSVCPNIPSFIIKPQRIMFQIMC